MSPFGRYSAGCSRLGLWRLGVCRKLTEFRYLIRGRHREGHAGGALSGHNRLLIQIKVIGFAPWYPVPQGQPPDARIV